MADENQKTDFEITPEMGSPCNFGKKPTKKERINREKEERMGKVTMVLEIELTVDETEEKVHVGKESGHHTRDCSPGLDFLILYRLANDCPCQRMGQTVHKFMVTRRPHLRQQH